VRGRRRSRLKSAAQLGEGVHRLKPDYFRRCDAREGDAGLREGRIRTVQVSLAPFELVACARPRTTTGKLQRFRLREVSAMNRARSPTRKVLAPNGWAPPRGYANGVVAAGRVIALAGQIRWNPATTKF
jgi:hypothetical protein